MEIFQMILLIVALQQILLFVKSECDFINYRRIIPASETKFSVDITFSPNNGFGFWMRYLPQFQSTFDTKITENEKRQFFLEKPQDQNLLFKNQAENFVCSLINKTSNEILLIHQQNIKIKQQRIDHEIWLNFQKEKGNLTFSFEKYQYEGVWIMFYMYFDLNQCVTTIAFWSQSKMQWQMQKITDCLNQITILQLQIGWLDYKVYFQNKLYVFENYHGQYTNVFLIANKNIIETGIKKCLDKLKALDYCSQQTALYLNQPNNVLVIKFNNSQGGLLKVRNLFLMVGLNQTLQYQKLRKIQQFLESHLMKIIMMICIQEIGFYILNTLKIVYLIKMILFLILIPMIFLIQINIKLKKKIQFNHLNQFFLICLLNRILYNLKKVHKITMAILYLEYFHLNLVNYNIFGKKDKNYFAYTTLQIYFGGDKFSNTYLKGFLSNFYIQQLCSLQPQELVIRCHYSCNTCNGPTPNSCVTCNSWDNREYDQITQSCRCINSFFDYYESPICFNIFDIQIALNIIEQNHDEIICLIGYFEINKQCIECPYYQEYQTTKNLLCADCYLNPEIFKTELKQKINIKKIIRNISQVEIFVLNQNNNLIKIKAQVKCLDKQYQLNNLCYYCNEGCLNCIDFNTCYECQENFYLTNNQTSVTIHNCQKFETKENFQQLKCNNCKEGHCLSNNACLQCGENCKSCNNLKICNFCVDQQQYFITFDGINCKECLIANCKYCFQFYEIEQKIHTTLDFNFQNQNLSDIINKEGCAQCNDGYFFNFITFQYELKCSNFINTQDKINCIEQFNDYNFGVISKNGQTKCIKKKQKF